MSRLTPASDDLDLLLTAWFEGDARVREPETLYDSVIGRTSRSRPLPVWRLPERWIPVQLATRMQPRPRLVPILIAILLIAAVLAGAVFIGTRTTTTKLPPPFGVARNGQIVFVSDGHVALANPDGTAIHEVTSGDLFAASPIFSHDGTKIAYRELVLGADGESTSASLVVSDADGSHRVVIDHGAQAMTNASWSADGRWLTYVRYDGPPGAEHLMVAASDGTGSNDLRELDGLGVWGPTWSPDGTTIAVSTGDDAGGALYVIGRDGSSARKVTTAAYPEVGQQGEAAEWSPDGKRLLFTAGPPGGVAALYTVGLDGLPEQPFAPFPRGDQKNGVWSPDGSEVAFLRAGVGLGPVVMIADADGNIIRALPGYYAWTMPAWSADGKEVAILDDRPGPNDTVGGPLEIDILDVAGVAQPIKIPAPIRGNGGLPDYTLTWQRLTP